MFVKEKILEQMNKKMKDDEKSNETIYKYTRDVTAFLNHVDINNLKKDDVVLYKKYIGERYSVNSANSMIAAVNYMLKTIGMEMYAVKTFKVQKTSFRNIKKELTVDEYFRLIDAAETSGNITLSLIMQTICSTGIRIGELPFITVEAVLNKQAEVANKGKTRIVILPCQLCKSLSIYAKNHCILSGSIFVTKNGKMLDRNNIAHAMKRLGLKAHVDESKIFPHNLRHLFAVTYYEAEKDISHLADILDHSNINTTRIYTMVSCTKQEEKINNLGLCRYTI